MKINPEKRVNPRFNRRFTITIELPNRTKITGTAVEPSAFGATIEITQRDYKYLQDNPALWEKERQCTVNTHLNTIEACINGLKENDENQFLLGLKLLSNRTWYS